MVDKEKNEAGPIQFRPPRFKEESRKAVCRMHGGNVCQIRTAHHRTNRRSAHLFLVALSVRETILGHPRCRGGSLVHATGY